MNVRYGFIGGLHRSGTSLLTRCLAEHPQAAAFGSTSVWEDEGQHLQDALLPARLLGGPGRFAHHAAARGPRVDRSAADALRARLLSTWEPLWDPLAPVRLSKSPPNLLRGPLLQQVFPASVLFVMKRHPIAVALATQQMSRHHRRLDLIDLVDHWLIAHEVFEQQRPELGSLLVIDHAELVARPAILLARAFAALDLEPVSPPEEIVDTDAKYRSQWSVLIGSRRRGPALRQALAARESRSRSLGYSLEEFAHRSGPVLSSLSMR